MKIDKIYSRIELGGKCWIIARVKQNGEFSIEQIEVTEQKYKNVKEGYVI